MVARRARNNIRAHRAVSSDHPRICLETFGVVLDLQTLFSTALDDPCSQQPFCYVFLMPHTLVNLHARTKDLSVCIP